MGAFFRAENWPLGWPLTALVVAAVLYHLGGRASARPSPWRSSSFYAGLGVLALAVDSPVDAYADRLFFVHMIQHVLLTMVAPPLLLLGRPWPRLARAFPLGTRRTVLGAAFGLPPLRRLADRLEAPVVSFALYNGVLLGWHLPVLYDLTLRSQLVHDLEHGLFFGTAILFWRHLLPAGRRSTLSDAARVAYGAAAIVAAWVLGVVLASAAHPLYAAYQAVDGRPLGLSALADQQLAAGVMWVPACIPYTLAILVAAYRWLDPASPARRRRALRPRET